MNESGGERRRYEVVHRTDYGYAGPVSASYGQTHLVPRELEDQRRVSYAVECDPVAAERHEHVDFYGNTTTYFAIESAHRRLSVQARSVVDVSRVRPDPDQLDVVGWEEARAGIGYDVEAREFAIASPLVQISPGVSAYAAQSFDRGRGLGSALALLTARIHADFTYRTGATTVRTTLDELLSGRYGVCQDFAHFAVGCLRSVGLAARYVSGYLETRPPAGQPRMVGSDASHAWADVLVPDIGWIGIDPTNNCFVDAGYIITAWGRDYADVAPLSGVIVTASRHTSMKVSVDVVRVDGT
jgi:transglutaminase-like putative cysteine protease